MAVPAQLAQDATFGKWACSPSMLTGHLHNQKRMAKLGALRAPRERRQMTSMTAPWFLVLLAQYFLCNCHGRALLWAPGAWPGVKQWASGQRSSRRDIVRRTSVITQPVLYLLQIPKVTWSRAGSCFCEEPGSKYFCLCGPGAVTTAELCCHGSEGAPRNI